MGVSKIGRNYKLDIERPNGETVTVRPPFSIKFSLTRNTLSTTNVVNIELINLSANTRKKLYKDKYTAVGDWFLSLSAGYGDNMPEIMLGNVKSAQSVKNGTNWITTIVGADSLFAITNGFSDFTLSAGATYKDLSTAILADLDGVTNIVIGDIGSTELTKDTAVFGPSYNILQEYFEDKMVFIDKTTLFIIDNDEIIGTGRVLTRRNMLSTPRRRDTSLDVSVLFEPYLDLGYAYFLQSNFAEYEGAYKCIGFTHLFEYNTYSGGVAVTNINLYYGAEGLKLLT